jgi:polyphosphate kinase
MENRELSWLAFNARVLDEAREPSVPLLDRVRFLAIFSSNLDEFFMVRYAGIWRQIVAGSEERGPDGRTPREALDAVARVVRQLVAAQHEILVTSILPELRAAGVSLLRGPDLDAEQRAFASDFFDSWVLPLLTPVAIDPGHPFPYLSNRGLALVAEFAFRGAQRFGTGGLCIVHLPAAGLPRFVALPAPAGRQVFMLLEDLVRMHLGALFPGADISAAHAIRVTRDAELDLEDEPAADMLRSVEAAVRGRRLGAAVRLQYEPDLPPTLVDRIATELELEASDVYAAAGILALTDLGQLHALVDLPSHRSPGWTPTAVPEFADGAPIMAVMERQDVLVHHPYQSFEPVVRFIEEAAADREVLAIKMTLYRVGGDSRIGRALLAAATNGKQVAVLVELRARFSEEANIEWARRLEAAGAHVVYGLARHKTHAKAALVVRRTAAGITRYCHLGTGNYNEQNASQYTDFGLFTAREGFGEDLTHLFNLLTGYAPPPPRNHLLVAPLDLRDGLVARVRREAENAAAGGIGRITAKVNSLVDPVLIDELYAASKAGVHVDLVVRGICCLRPGVPGLSDRIRVVSIVDRFLEHGRVARFENAGSPEYWLSSADWMPRNLDGRVEIAFPVLDMRWQAEIDAYLALQLADHVKGRTLGPDGDRPRPPRGDGEPSSQSLLMQAYVHRGRVV